MDSKLSKIAALIEDNLESGLSSKTSFESKEDLKKYLSGLIETMIQNDFARFLNVMYRFDISEEKLKAAMSTANTTEVSYKIAELVVEREEEKIKWREKYKP